MRKEKTEGEAGERAGDKEMQKTETGKEGRRKTNVGLFFHTDNGFTSSQEGFNHHVKSENAFKDVQQTKKHVPCTLR